MLKRNELSESVAPLHTVRRDCLDVLCSRRYHRHHKYVQDVSCDVPGRFWFLLLSVKENGAFRHVVTKNYHVFDLHSQSRTVQPKYSLEKKAT